MPIERATDCLHASCHRLINADSRIKTEYYFSNGQKGSEQGAALSSQFWLPDGTPTVAPEWGMAPRQWMRAWKADNGDGTFRELEEQP
jgi:hypothetical protein